MLAFVLIKSSNKQIKVLSNTPKKKKCKLGWLSIRTMDFIKKIRRNDWITKGIFLSEMETAKMDFTKLYCNKI